MPGKEGPYHYVNTNKQCSFRPILYTKRLTLTLWDPEDAGDMEFGLAFFKDGAIIGALGRPLFSTAEQIRAHRASTQLLPEHTPLKQSMSGPSVWFMRLGSRNANGTPIGMINITSRDPNLPPDIGWGVIEAHQGNGYASEAAVRVAAYIMDEFQGGFRNACPPCGLVATLNEKNSKSAAVARKVGLVPMGDILYCGSEDRVAVYGVPDLNINGGKPFTSDLRINVFGFGEPLKRTLMLLFGQEQIPDKAFEPPVEE